MICPTCGCNNPDENTKCEVCGTELVRAEDVIEISNNDKKSIDKSKIIIISLITVIVVVIIITIAVVVSLNKSNKNTYDSISNLNITEVNDFTNDYDTIHMQDNDEYGIDETDEYDTTVKPKTQTINSTTRSEKEINREKALDCLKKADAALKSGEREGALQMADTALELCKDDDIKKKYDKIYEYAPFKLYDEDNMLQVEHSSNYYTMSSIKSNDQTEMKDCLVIFYNWTDENDPIQKITYNLKGNYDVVSGTEFIDNATKNIKQEGYFEIFGDGKKLYTSQTFKPAVLPKEFKINVSNIDTLIVVFHGHTDHWDPMNNAAGYSISNFIALKNLP